MPKEMLFRPHRGLLAEAMSEAIKLPNTKTALMELIQTQWQGWATLTDIEVSHYCYDKRIDWDTWIVVGIFSDLTERPVVGFTNSTVENE